jgi:hypothetical protein
MLLKNYVEGISLIFAIYIPIFKEKLRIIAGAT